MGFDPITMAATISKLESSGQIGGVTKTENVAFPKTKLEYEIIEESGVPSAYGNALAQSTVDFIFTLEADKTYVVDISGVKYTGVAKLEQMEGQPDIIVIGDMFAPFTEVPFVVAYYPSAYAAYVMVLEDHIGDGTVAIYEQTETVQPIDPKYITKTINLSDYSIAEQDVTTIELLLNKSIVQAMTAGSASFPYDEAWPLFLDLDTDSPIALKFAFGESNAVKINSPDIIYGQYDVSGEVLKPVMLCFSPMVELPTGDIAKVNVIITPTYIYVKMESIGTAPTA